MEMEPNSHAGDSTLHKLPLPFKLPIAKLIIFTGMVNTARQRTRAQRQPGAEDDGAVGSGEYTWRTL
jgi:hypothetical protein